MFLQRVLRPELYSRASIAALASIYLLLTASSVHAQDAFPPVVDSALLEAEAQSNLLVSFTMTFQWPGIDDIVQRFDATSGTWSKLAGKSEQLNAAGRKKLQTYKRLESKPGGLTYADFRPHLQEVTLLEETKVSQIYSFTSPRTPDDMDNVDDIVRSRLVINLAGPGLEEYHVQALQPYKPNPVVKLEAFTFTQKFERQFPGTPPLMTQLYWQAKGSRMFQTIDEEFTILFSDFEIVTVE